MNCDKINKLNILNEVKHNQQNFKLNVGQNEQAKIPHLQKAPSNPSYWQGAVGIKKSPSFRGAAVLVRQEERINEDRRKFLAYIPERKKQQLSEESIEQLCKLTNSPFEKAKQLLYIEERGENQLLGSSIELLSKLSDEQFKTVKDLLLYIPERKQNQFTGAEIVKLIQLEQEQFEQAQDLFYVEEREENQFQGYEIINLAQLNAAQFKRAKTLFKLPERKNNQFDGYEILTLAKLEDEQFKKAQTLFLIDDLGKKNQLSGFDIKKIAKLPNSQYEKAISLLKLPFYKESEVFVRNILQLAQLNSHEDFELFMDLVHNADVVCLNDAQNICLYDDIKEKYFDIKALGFNSKNSAIIANMEFVEESQYEDVNNLLNALDVDSVFGENVALTLYKYLTLEKEVSLDIKDLTKYIKSVDMQNLEKVAPEFKNYTFEQRLKFFDYHCKAGTTDFSTKNMTLDKDITQYLMKNYLSVGQLTELFYRYPATSRKVGEMPAGWLDNIPNENHENAIDEIYSAIIEFQTEREIELFTTKMTKILGKKVEVEELSSGTFGTGYKISTEGSRDMCLKVFNKKDSSTEKEDSLHGRHIEVQTALFTNQHSNDFVKMYFGKVAPLGMDDGFMVTEFLSEDITPTENPNIDDDYIVTTRDFNQDHNFINGKIIDFGSIKVKKKL